MNYKKYLCDICGKGDRNKELIELREMYQNYDIKMVCDSCGKMMDDYLDKLRDLERGKFQIFWRWSTKIWKQKMKTFARFKRMKFKGIFK